jgi:15-cis-phytoene synthase
MPQDPIIAHSRESIEKGSKSFALAAKLLPASIRDDAFMLYGWCRHCDDVIDQQVLGFASAGAADGPVAERLAILRAKTAGALAGRATEPVFIALSRVAKKHAIPERHPMELLAGFEMDASGRHYETIEDTLAYCYHVAGVVGVMMAMIMGVREGAVLNRASDLGLAFQLTNIARDVIEDAKVGRIYLPAEWLSEARVPAAAIIEPSHRQAVFVAVQRLLREADAYYASAFYGLRELPLRTAIGIGAARRIYRDIGQIVIGREAGAWDKRAAAGRMRKIGAAFSGAAAAVRAHMAFYILSEPSREGLWTMPGLGEIQ